MTSAREIIAARAAVALRLDRDQLEAGFKAVQVRVANFGKFVDRVGDRLKSFGGSLSKIGTVGTAGFGSVLGVMAKLASVSGDVTEEVGQLDAVFGSASGQVESFANTMADAIGRGVNESRRQLITLGAAFKGSGFSDSDAAELVKRAQTVAADLASAFGKGDTQAGSEAVAAALTGERERLKQLQVFIKESDVKASLGDLGFDPATATNAQKTLATLALIEEKAAQLGATGNAISTRNSFANQVEGIKGQAADLAAVLGGPLEQAMLPLLTRTAEIVGQLTQWAAANPELIGQLGQLVVVGAAVSAGVLVLGGGITALGVIVSAVSTAVGVLGAILGVVLTPAGAIGVGVVAIGALAAAFVDWGAAMERTRAILGKVTGDTENTISAVKAAISAGDMEAAWEVVMLKIQLIVKRGMSELQRLAQDAIRDMARGFEEFPGFGQIAQATGFGVDGLLGSDEDVERIRKHEDEYLRAYTEGTEAQIEAIRKRSEDAVRAKEEAAAVEAAAKQREAAQRAVASAGDSTPGVESGNVRQTLTEKVEEAGRRANMKVEPELDASTSLNKIRDELDQAVGQAARSFELNVGEARFDAALLSELTGDRGTSAGDVIQQKIEAHLARIAKRKAVRVMASPV